MPPTPLKNMKKFFLIMKKSWKKQKNWKKKQFYYGNIPSFFFNTFHSLFDSENVSNFLHPSTFQLGKFIRKLSKKIIYISPKDSSKFSLKQSSKKY